MSDERTPTDGKPYYCALCGCGFGEFLACELPDCQLETDRKALNRASRAKANRRKKRAAAAQETT